MFILFLIHKMNRLIIGNAQHQDYPLGGIFGENGMFGKGGIFGMGTFAEPLSGFIGGLLD